MRTLEFPVEAIEDLSEPRVNTQAIEKAKKKGPALPLSPIPTAGSGLCLLLVLQRSAEDVAERSARVRRTELSNGFLLVREFHGLH